MSCELDGCDTHAVRVLHVFHSRSGSTSVRLVWKTSLREVVMALPEWRMFTLTNARVTVQTGGLRNTMPFNPLSCSSCSSVAAYTAWQSASYA